MRTASLAVLLALTACSSPESPAAPEAAKSGATAAPRPAPPTKAPPAKDARSVILSADGLFVGGQLVRFGIPRADAETSVGAALGDALTRDSSSECAAGPIDSTTYRDNLQLTFQEGKFAGWTINGGESPLRTAKGIGIGLPRQSVEAAYPDAIVDESSLGLLFSTGDLVGLFDQDGIEGIVTDIWAGTVCLVD